MARNRKAGDPIRKLQAEIEADKNSISKIAREIGKLQGIQRRMLQGKAPSGFRAG